GDDLLCHAADPRKRSMGVVLARLSIGAERGPAAAFRNVVTAVVVSRVLAEDGIAEREADRRHGAPCITERVAEIAVGAAAALEEDAAVPVLRQAQVVADRIRLAVGAGALVESTYQFAMGRNPHAGFKWACGAEVLRRRAGRNEAG